MTITCPKCKVERTSLDCGQCLAQKLVDMHDAQKKRADEAEAKFAEAVEFLKGLEWIQVEGGHITQFCPGCGSNNGTHKPGCRLAALIGKAGA